jgi:hypothetical protein
MQVDLSGYAINADGGIAGNFLLFKKSITFIAAF